MLKTPMHACDITSMSRLTQPPGTWFYHPHAHGASDDEEAGGLAGAWIVDLAKRDIRAADEHLPEITYVYPFAGDYNYMPATRTIGRAARRTQKAERTPEPLVAYGSVRSA